MEHAPALARSVAPLRHAVTDLAAENGVSVDQLERIALAVSEALTNVVMHAYVGHDQPGVVAVEAWVHERSLHVTVSDEGIGMRARSDSPGLGLGLVLIRGIADVRLDDNTPGVRMHMTFALE